MCMNFDSSCTFFIQGKKYVTIDSRTNRGGSRCEREKLQRSTEPVLHISPCVEGKTALHADADRRSGSEHRDDADGCSSERSCGIESGKRK